MFGALLLWLWVEMCLSIVATMLPRRFAKRVTHSLRVREYHLFYAYETRLDDAIRQPVLIEQTRCG